MLAIATQWFIVANFAPLGFAFSNALLWLWAGIIWGSRGEKLVGSPQLGPHGSSDTRPALGESWAMRPACTT